MTAPDLTAAYGIEGPFLPYGRGHIHDTYRSADSRFLLQRVNTGVFRDPRGMMKNIVRVTEHLRKKLTEEGLDPARRVLRPLRTRDGQLLAENEDGFFRVYEFIPHSVTAEPENINDRLRFEAAAGFGRFQRRLADFDASCLHETIPDFHNTPRRLAQLEEAVWRDAAGRAGQLRREIDFIRENAGLASTVTDGLRRGEIPLCVTHNDTKINNILFDEESGEALCVIDLDTVMPGSRLYDFGDLVRSAVVPAPEDERDLSRVVPDLNAYEAFLRGYLSEMRDLLWEREKELLPFSVRLLAFELGVRFLTDYLDGDVYFRPSRPGRNLDRARAQLRLFDELKKRDGALRRLTEAVLKE